MTNEKDDQIPTITCEHCEREWPTISEQGVVYDKIGRCYACFITEVVAERDARTEGADYTIENCPACTGGLGDRTKCMTCFGRGWRKAEGESLIQLVR